MQTPGSHGGIPGEPLDYFVCPLRARGETWGGYDALSVEPGTSVFRPQVLPTS